MIPEVHGFPRPDDVVAALAEDFARQAEAVCQTRRRFVVALAGGRTPEALYRTLAGAYRERVPWRKVHVFFGDERYVGPEDPASNYRMVREALLDRVPIPAGQVYPMPTTAASPEEAARRYEAGLLTFFHGTPRLDWVLLGLGEDGHTASLFPNLDPPPAAWVAAVTRAPKPPSGRLTLTYRTFNQARQVAFLVTGKGKAEAVRRVFGGVNADLPAQRIRPQERLAWFLDRAAAQGVLSGAKRGPDGLALDGGN